MRRFLILGCVSFMGMASSYADVIKECPEPKNIVPEIIWEVTPLEVSTVLSVRELMLKSNKPINFESNSFKTTLGYYTGESTVSVSPSLMKTTMKNSRGDVKVCYNLEGVKIKISYTPKIYIASEAMQYHCTKSRVYEHELKHYNIDVVAYNRLPKFMKDYGYKNLMKLNYITDESQVMSVISKTSSEVSEYIKLHTRPHHELMDTEENYKREMDLCSVQENKSLIGLIRNGQNAAGVVRYNVF